MSDAFVPPASPVPPQAPYVAENVGRGALVALVTVPVGILVWVVLWGFGVIASLVAAGVAFLAVRLYLKGAGRMTRAGAVVVLAITVVTLLLAFFGGIVLDAAQGFGEGSGLGAWGAFTHADFWPAFWQVWPDAAPSYLPDLAWAIGFGALGSFATLRAAFGAARATAQPSVSPYTAPDTAPYTEPYTAPYTEPAAEPAIEPPAPELP